MPICIYINSHRAHHLVYASIEFEVCARFRKPQLQVTKTQKYKPTNQARERASKQPTMFPSLDPKLVIFAPEPPCGFAAPDAAAPRNGHATDFRWTWAASAASDGTADGWTIWDRNGWNLADRQWRQASWTFLFGDYCLLCISRFDTQIKVSSQRSKRRTTTMNLGSLSCANIHGLGTSNHCSLIWSIYSYSITI